jgi:hypothetical protein
VKLVVIYGAPAVGKLTTARALAALTGFKLFHNHLTFDLARAMFDFPSAPFTEFSEKVRLLAFESAARARVPGMIFTFVYAAPDDDAFVKSMAEAVERQGGSVAFVRLVCGPEAHEQRVAAPERTSFGKITSVAGLREALRRWNLSEKIALRDSLEIDNSLLHAQLAARRIAAHFSLPIIADAACADGTSMS